GAKRMSIVVKKPKKYRAAEIQSAYDQLIAKNRQLKTTIDDTERRSIESLAAVSLLMLRRWWHRTSIRVGLKRARSTDEFNLEPVERTSRWSAWSHSLRKLEEQALDHNRSGTVSLAQAGQSTQRARALTFSKELGAKCDELYAEYREKIWQRRQA